MAEVKLPGVELKFMLMGKTGYGKSTTGNMILDRKAFNISADTTSVTKSVSDGYSEFGLYNLQVVDGPGLEDTDMDKVKDKETAAKMMDEALAKCDGGVDAFLLVTRFGLKFTEEDRSVLDSLKAIFGDSFMKHLIVVVSAGDQFQFDMEQEERDVTFDQWCKEQKGAFRKLYDDCGGWFVLFNNREKDGKKKRAQVQQIVQLAHGLQKRCSRYTSKCFESAKNQREKLIVEMKAPQLKKEFQQTISLLTGSIEKLSKNPSDTEKENIRSKIQTLKNEIDNNDKGTGVLQDMRKLLEQVQDNLNDVEKLHSLAKELESTRKAKTIWTVLGAVCTVVGGIIAIVVPPIGIAAAVGCAATVGTGAVATGAGYAVFASAEKDLENTKTGLEKKSSSSMSAIRQSQVKMAEVELARVELNFVLMGKTGQGKSATGNMILDRKAFKTSAFNTAVTKSVSDGYSECGPYNLRVVDGLGLDDTDMDKVKDKETAARMMNEALAKCGGGVDAFLLVTRFGCRFTEQDRSVLDSLKAIFGDSFMKHVIVVVTCGDQFQSEMEDQECDVTFDQWCNEQEGAFRKLYDDCGGWFVLFNNSEKDGKKKRAQVQQIVQLAHGLQKRCGRYTSKCFESAKLQRK